MGTPRSKLPRETLFMQRVNKTQTCWLWTGPLDRDGYGEWQYAERRQKAHRWAYELFVGALGALQACHSCDVPNCVNPAHLFRGTQADNIHDMQAKGRKSPKHGEHHHMAILDEKTVLSIRAEYDGKRGSRSRIARERGLNYQTVSDVIMRRRWSHLP